MKARILVAVFGLIVLLVLAINGFGQGAGPDYGWTKRIGGSFFDRGEAVAVDNAGNAYVTGYFLYGPVNFGYDFGTVDIKYTAGSFDVFITKINSDGTYGWTRVIGGEGDDWAHSIATDSMGNVYVTGYYCRTVDFGADFGTADSKTCAGYIDGFITKINSNGTYGWTRGLGSYGSDIANAVATDSAGNVYVAGIYSGTVDFGADFGATDSKGCAGSYDIFITKIKSDGTYGWTKRIGGAGNDHGESIAVDPAGNVYITGYFSEMVDFGDDFGVNDSRTSSGLYDIFVTKINADGTYGWTRRMGGAGNDNASSIAVDPDSDVYVTGAFYSGTLDFGSDFGATDSKTSAGSCDIFITKIKTDGTYGWTKQIGGTYLDGGDGIAVDAVGNVYATGLFFLSVDFGSDFGTSDIKNAVGGNDIFITKIASDGTYGWTKRMGGAANDWGFSVAAGSSGTVYVTGYFYSPTVDFGADFGASDPKMSFGNADVFVTKILPPSGYTPPGDNVPVQPADPATGETPVTITFSDVIEGGETTLTITPTGTPPPAGLRLGNPPQYYVIETTAVYTGPITICINYAGISYGGSEDNIQLFHNYGGNWEAIPTTVYPATKMACGEITSLSEFAIFELEVEAEGFQEPLAALVPAGETPPIPDVAFKQGRTLPLKLRLFSGNRMLTNADVAPPKIVGLVRSGSAIPLETLDLGSGEANDSGPYFRFSDGNWVYNLSTKSLRSGTYMITLEIPDGDRLCAGFVLR